MPRRPRGKYPNRGRLPLPPTNPETDDCVRVFVPDSQYHRDLLFGMLERPAKWTTYETDDTGQGAVNAALRWRVALRRTYEALGEPCDDKKPRKSRSTPFDWWWNGDGGYTIRIEEDCEMPVNVYIYEGCCGDEGQVVGGGGSGGDIVAGGNIGSSGGGLESEATRCDIATTVLPYFVAQMREWLVALDTAITQGANLIEAVLETPADIIDPTDASPQLIENTTNVLRVQLDPLIAAMGDTDLMLQTQVNWWGRNTKTRFSAFTRQDAIEMGRSLPIAWNIPSITQVSSPRLIGEFFGRIANINKLNGRLFLAVNSSNDQLCSYLASQNDENYEPTVEVAPPDPNADPIIISPSYWLSPQFTTIGENIALPGGNDLVRNNYPDYNFGTDNLSDYPGVVGIYIWGNVSTGQAVAGGSFQVVPIVGENNISNFAALVAGAGLTPTGSDFDAFIGTSGLEGLWTDRSATYITTITAANAGNPNCIMAVGPHNNWPATTITATVNVRYLIDSTVQAPPA